jgi:hypothetical protein
VIKPTLAVRGWVEQVISFPYGAAEFTDALAAVQRLAGPPASFNLGLYALYDQEASLHGQHGNQ